MIEHGRFPIRAVMALSALLAPRPAVAIVLCMAVDTLAWQVLPALIGVASDAALIAMRARQGETGLPVIKGKQIAPAAHLVAALAFGPQASTMGVVRLMAPDAATGRIAEMGRFTMALGTGHTSMRAGQRIICLVVVKGGAVDLYKVKIAALVITMAGLAGLTAGGGAAVITLGQLDV